MSKQPFMPLFFGDFLAATGEWEGEEASLYLTLLGHQWSLGSLPNDSRKLARLVKWDQKLFDRCWPIVSGKFLAVGERLLNTRLEEHRQKTKDLSVKNSASGQKGAESRWRKDSERQSGANGESMANAMQNDGARDGERHESANGVTDGNPSHPIPSHPDPSQKLGNSPQASRVVTPIPRARPSRTEGNGRFSGDEATAAIQDCYPAGTFGAQNWIQAERCIAKLIDGGTTAAVLIDAAARYCEQQRAKGDAIGTQFIRSPEKFYGEGYWRGPFPLPATKADTRLGANLNAAEEFMRRTEPAQ